MALQKSHTVGEVTHASAYHVVAQVNLSPIDGTAKAYVFIYSNAAAKANGDQPIDTARYIYTVDTSPTFAATLAVVEVDPVNQNAVERVYEDIKTKAKYSGATDV